MPGVIAVPREKCRLVGDVLGLSTHEGTGRAVGLQLLVESLVGTHSAMNTRSGLDMNDDEVVKPAPSPWSHFVRRPGRLGLQALHGSDILLPLRYGEIAPFSSPCRRLDCAVPACRVGGQVVFQLRQASLS